MAVMKSNNTSSVYFTSNSNSKNGMKRERLSFTNLDAGLIIFSMVTIVAHLVTDIILILSYYLAGHKFWAFSTVALALIPALTIQAFSIRWHVLDNAASLSKWLNHCCLLGVFFRHVDALQTGLEARRSGDVADFQSLFHQQSDISMLQLFESFMKSAPQLVLQLYIMIQVQDWGPWTGMSAGASLISLAWAMAVYTHAMRQARPDKQKASLSGLALQAVWRSGLLVARIAALVLFAICCQAWLFLLLGLHWLGMTVWVVLQKTDLCSTPWEECAYNCVVGVVYCFCFFNLREGRARGRMLAFYIVTVTQNLACLYLFLALAQHTHPLLANVSAAAVVGGTIIGLCAMLTYYRFFHPSGPITLFGPQISVTNSLTQSGHGIERSSVQSAPVGETHISIIRSTSQVQLNYTQSSQMPSDVEKSNSLRSLKHLWSVDRDGSLSSRSDDVPPTGGSPQPDDSCTDRRLLLSCRGSTRRPPSAGAQVSVGEMSKQSSTVLNPGILPASCTTSQTSCGTSQTSCGTSHGSCGNHSSPSSTSHSRSHQSPPTTHQGWTTHPINVTLSNQSVHSTNTTYSSSSGNSNLINNSSVISRNSAQIAKPLVTEEPNTQGGGIDIDDSKLSWNCTSMMEDTQHSEIIDTIPAEVEINGACSINKRRGICSSVELDLDKLEDSGKDALPELAEASSKLNTVDESFAVLCQKLVANAEVKQLGSIESITKDMLKKSVGGPKKEEKDEKRESDYIDSKQSAISSDGTSSEVLSAHDYENICAVNIAREAWGLRSWRGYSDIETWLHDDSVVRDRRRDTLASIGTTTTVTSASSERSTASESPPPARQWENCDTSAPPLPCRRPRSSYNRMDDYLDTLAYDLAEIEQREIVPIGEDNIFMAQPYVVDQNGMLYPLPVSLDTILEELEESSVSASTVTAPESGSIPPGWASSLVATIDEIRMGTSNTLEDSGTVSESDFDVGSYRSLQLDSSAMTNVACQGSPDGTNKGQQRFSSSLPSLLQVPRSWSHLTPEEVLFLSELKPQPENEVPKELKSGVVSSNDLALRKKSGRRPRRKFSLIREKFETKSDVDDKNYCNVEDLRQDMKDFNEGGGEDFAENLPIFLSSNNISQSEKSIVNNLMNFSGKRSPPVIPFKETDLKSPGWSTSEKVLSFRGQTLLQQVIGQPKLVPHNKKLVLDSNASA
ncbi:XK-related protein 6 [Frankliniella fusca]|uniref:XK-related protein n=1 Tax=Frankliniella fusca TaxID=407009 RepID=A0AAE1HCY4_9NEOP|nr:XK-related protein 6 [Frankliniella fusca]